MEVPFALSIHKFINDVGADAGFAAFIGVAIMALLYFAQARETATLRERLNEAHDRIGGLEARISQLLHLQSARPAPATAAHAAPVTPAPVTPAPASSRPMGSAIASVRRLPGATPATAPAADGAPGGYPAAPVGLGGPALASATKLIPDPPLSAPTAVQEAAVANGNGAGNGEAPTAAATAAAAVRRDPQPPRMQVRPEGAGAGPVPRRSDSAPPPTRPAVPASAGARPRDEDRFEQFDSGRRGGLAGVLRGRLLPLGIIAGAAIVIIGGVIVIEGTGSSAPTTSNVSHNRGTSHPTTGGKTHRKHHTGSPALAPGKVTVAVLNGTSVSHLASDVSRVLSGKGYKGGSVTNGTSQTQATTVVYYKTGFRSAARRVAGALGLGASAVQAAPPAVLKACGTTPTGSATTCQGDVIVSAGQDRANLASSSSSSAG